MTPERLAQLRELADYVAYHVPNNARPDLREAMMTVGTARADMLELCDAVMAAQAALEIMPAPTRIFCTVCGEVAAGHRCPPENVPKGWVHSPEDF